MKSGSENNSAPPSQVDFPTKPLPRVKSWARGLARGAGLVGCAVGIAMGSNWALIAAVVLVILFTLSLGTDRCPQCKGPLNSRQVEEAPGYRRMHNDCPNCKITWLSQDVSVDG